MQELDLGQVVTWSQVGRGGGKLFKHPKFIDTTCPNPGCRRSLVNLDLKWGDNGDFIWTRSSCAGCRQQFHFFLISPPTEGSEAVEQTRLYIHPDPPLDLSLVTPEVEACSPMFVKIYQQAVTAENAGLDELVGMSYRKAIEFLMKDYLCQKMPDQASEIKKKALTPCINQYVTNQNVKDCAKRAVWLGNDHTHYVQRRTDRDLEDLKLLLKLTLHWITMELLTQGYVDDLPE